MDIPHFSPAQYTMLHAAARRQAQVMRRKDVADGAARLWAWLRRLVGTRGQQTGGAPCRS